MDEIEKIIRGKLKGKQADFVCARMRPVVDEIRKSDMTRNEAMEKFIMAYFDAITEGERA